MKRFDGNPTDHYHIRCVCCDSIVDAPMSQMAGLDHAVDVTTGYRILGHRLEFIGLCPDCAESPISPGLRRMRKISENL